MSIEDSNIDSAIAKIKKVITRIQADATLAASFNAATISERIAIVEIVIKQVEGR